LKIFDINQDRETKKSKVFKGPISSISFSENGNIVACAAASHSDTYNIRLETSNRKGLTFSKTVLEGH